MYFYFQGLSPTILLKIQRPYLTEKVSRSSSIIKKYTIIINQVLNSYIRQALDIK